MENQIVKVSPEMKSKLAKIVGCKWSGVRVVIVETNGITVYHHEYGMETFVSFDKLIG